MKTKTCAILALLLCLALTARAQVDSASVRIQRLPPLPGLAFSLTPLAAGTAARFAWPSRFGVPSPKHHDGFAKDALPFAPLAATWVLKGFGVPTRDGWGQMAVNQAASAALGAAVTYGLKNSVKATRPDGHNDKSWPSGHTMWAFMTATMAARELGQASAWYPMGAYFIATGVGAQRVLSRHHLPADVMAGAGIGILATQVGYALGDLVTGRKVGSGFSLEKGNANFANLSVEMGLAMPLGRVAIPGGKLQRLPAYTAALRAARPLGDSWGLALEAGFSTTPLVVETACAHDFMGNLTAIGGTLSPYYNRVLSRRVSFTAELGAGYYRNLRLKSAHGAVRAGNGSLTARATAGVAVRFTDHFSARASLGYQISHHSFTVAPVPDLGITQRGRASGATSSLLFKLSSTYEF